ncbi:hypothetical protein ACQ4LE_000720 [Meloidogyne hapla]|uniref:Uncharacterized protein n=1 Tax=Meloidogyne hapla TaxID=6305 RepID=A0A1I8BAJ3_MELHA
MSKIIFGYIIGILINFMIVNAFNDCYDNCGYGGTGMGNGMMYYNDYYMGNSNPYWYGNNHFHHPWGYTSPNYFHSPYSYGYGGHPFYYSNYHQHHNYYPYY